MEIWKEIQELNGKYSISSLARIRNNNSMVIKKVYVSPTGYECFSFQHNGIQTIKNLHRLYAQAFIPNPENKRVVNHKDGNKLNNDLSNLEWSSYSENINHAYENNLRTNKKEVVQISLDGFFINEYKSQKEAHRQTGISFQAINHAVRVRSKTAGGYIWK